MTKLKQQHPNCSSRDEKHKKKPKSLVNNPKLLIFRLISKEAVVENVATLAMFSDV